jgi:hypothetical protein
LWPLFGLQKFKKLTENQEKKQGVVEYINDFPTEEEERRAAAIAKKAEADFQLAQKRAARKKLFLKYLLIASVIVGIVGAVSLLVYRSFTDSEISTEKKTVSVPIPENKDHVFISDNTELANLNEDDGEFSDSEGGLVGKSENFHIKDISIGGMEVILAAEAEALPLAIKDVRTETLLSKDGKETRLLISWKTNKLSQSEISYLKTGGEERVLKDDNFGFSHALVLNKLDQATRYSFVIGAIDRGGAKAKSDTFVIYTGSRAVSVFELISKEIDKIFGWIFAR